jgi:AraC-like DNA-binding protein
MRRIHPTIAPSRTYKGRMGTAELFLFRRFDVADMEFLLASHLIILLPDGVSGSCEYNSGDRVQTFRSMTPITVVFNPAQEYLRLRINKLQNRCRVLLLTIEPLALKRLRGDEPDQPSEDLYPLIGVDDQAVRQAMVAILQEIEDPSVHSALNIETFLMLALDRLLKYRSNPTAQPGQGYVKGGLPNWRLRLSLQMMEGNSGRMPHLSEIAETVNLHEASFCRAFKQSTGLSPHRYLLLIRVNRAKELMKDPNRTLTNIALDCGFSSSSQFSVAFKRIVGESPGRYRRSL